MTLVPRIDGIGGPGPTILIYGLKTGAIGAIELQGEAISWEAPPIEVHHLLSVL